MILLEVSDSSVSPRELFMLTAQSHNTIIKDVLTDRFEK